MVLVPAGEFLMGTDEVDTQHEGIEHGLPRPWYEDEHPLHRVKLGAFYIDATEVTNEAYAEFAKQLQRRTPDDWPEGKIPDGKANFPAAFVNWFDAEAFCRWKEKRLPTEEEWEKAARGPDGLKYPWGNLFDPSRAHIAREAVMIASSVAVKEFENGRSPYGAYDMIGNVWEWTDSWYEGYPGNQSQNEYFGRVFRVTKGLSFMGVGHYSPETYQRVASIIARASFRSYDDPLTRLTDLGFRCAKSAG